MKLMKIPTVCFVFLMGGFLAGCNKPPNQSDQGWTLPMGVTSSIDSLAGEVTLYKWHDTILVLQELGDRSARCFAMSNGKSNISSWAETPLIGIPHGYFWALPAMDETSDKVFFLQGYMEDNKFQMSCLIGRMSGNVAVHDVTEQKWVMDKGKVFGADNVRFYGLYEPGKRDFPLLGLGIMEGSELYIPYFVRGFTYDRSGTAIARGPNADGVFHSSDSGATWQMERISDFDAWGPSVYRTKNYYYYFATRGRRPGHELWFSRKLNGSGSWDTPKPVVAKTYAMEFGNYVAAAENDTVHLCWMDGRHNMWRFNIDGLNIENDDIVYCHRKDSDSGWSKDVVLSKGVLYCYAPSISVEGDKIVVAWAGIQTAGKWHTDYDPNDIYYVTSKDGGNTWSKPLKVTDGVKDGMTAGHPQVMLLNGVIHLFYIQGKMNLQQLSPGLTKLNQPPWPIYYTQRSFPE